MAKKTKQQVSDKYFKRKKPKKEVPKFRTIGVRLIEGPNLFKTYTYQVRVGASVHLGQELVADTPRGPGIAIAVRLDKTFNPDDYPEHHLKTITKKVAPL